jgi:hypothetical protein
MNFKNVIVITFVTSILIISSSQISFAKKNGKEEENDGKDLKKNIPVSSIDKTKKINRDSKEIEVQNDILNGGHYPNQYYVCGYPQQLITDYNSFEKFNCN